MGLASGGFWMAGLDSRPTAEEEKTADPSLTLGKVETGRFVSIGEVQPGRPAKLLLPSITPTAKR